MTVEELIKQLQGLPPDTEVNVWVDGKRKAIIGVDPSFWDDGHIDLDVLPEVRYLGNCTYEFIKGGQA